MPATKPVSVRRRRRRASRAPGGPRDPRSAARVLREVRKAQVETGEELARMHVPVATEPAFIFRA